jgi:CheY-like chemotaxis protein
MSSTSTSILLVEDDQDIRESVSELLELEGYTTVSTINGRDALEQLHRMEKPCLILLDVMMPVMDGHAFMKKIQEEQPLAGIPVVVMSASHKPPEGAKGYLSKPLDIDELLGWVRSCCGATHCVQG